MKFVDVDFIAYYNGDDISRAYNYISSYGIELGSLYKTDALINLLKTNHTEELLGFAIPVAKQPTRTVNSCNKEIAIVIPVLNNGEP